MIGLYAAGGVGASVIVLAVLARLIEWRHRRKWNRRREQRGGFLFGDSPAGDYRGQR